MLFCDGLSIVPCHMVLAELLVFQCLLEDFVAISMIANISGEGVE